MPRTISRAASRELDRRAIEEYGLSGLVLMENAGRGTTDVLCQQPINGSIIVVCGRGNNAGDGFVIARHLDLRGYRVVVLMYDAPDSLRGDAAVNHQILTRCGVPIAQIEPGQQDLADLPSLFSHAAWLVDAILGTGASGEPRPPYDAIIDAMNASGVPILAVDIPSGLDCDTGQPARHTIRAAVTCTFVAAKPGLLTEAAQPYVGQLHIIDIGAPRTLVESLLMS